MKNQDLNRQALEAWEEPAFRNCKSDLEVNDLLERISAEVRASYHPEDIYLTICNLPNSAKRRFIRLAAEI